MIDKENYNYSKEALIYYLTHEAGSSNPKYFHAKKAGGMKLQQVPSEYASLLLMLRDYGVESYLGLGIGNGGSFAMECFFMQKTLKSAMAVDNLAYRDLGIGQNEEEINKFISDVIVTQNVLFHNSTTDEFFKWIAEDIKFDAIFIDADHSYEGARKDYNNSLKHIEKGGLIIFHDINSEACPGIRQLWKEVKADHKNSWEFIDSNTCGIGVVQVK